MMAQDEKNYIAEKDQAAKEGPSAEEMGMEALTNEVDARMDALQDAVEAGTEAALKDDERLGHGSSPAAKEKKRRYKARFEVWVDQTRCEIEVGPFRELEDLLKEVERIKGQVIERYPVAFQSAAVRADDRES